VVVTKSRMYTMTFTQQSPPIPPRPCTYMAVFVQKGEFCRHLGLSSLLKWLDFVVFEDHYFVLGLMLQLCSRYLLLKVRVRILVGISYGNVTRKFKKSYIS